MSKLARYTQKLFASTPGLNQIGKFGSLAAGSPAYAANPGEAMSLSNWLTGWFGAVIGGNSPAIEDLNAFCYAMTHQVGHVMQMGIPEWDAGTDYYSGSIVNLGGTIYISRTDTNNVNKNPLVEFTFWKKYSFGDPTGTGKDHWGSILPDGYIWASGNSIGNTGSNATERASGDTFDLYSIFWNDYTADVCPMYTSAGAGATRGASAAADFAAGKTIKVIDKRGRVSVTRDNLGGFNAARIGTEITGATTIGSSGGAQNVTLDVTQMPSHSHGGTTGDDTPDHYHTMSAYGASIADNGSGRTFVADGGGGTRQTNGANTRHRHPITAQGGGLSHTNMQPSIVCNYIIKL